MVSNTSTNASVIFGGDSTDDAFRTLVATVMLILVVFIVTGNISVLVCIWKNTEAFSKTFKIYSLALATNDLSFGLTSPVLRFAHLVHPSFVVGSRWLCVIWTVCEYGLISVSILLLNTMAYDRYRCVRNPVQCRATSSRRKAVLIAMAAWALGFVFWIPFVFFTVYDVELTQNAACAINFDKLSFLLMGFAYLVPTVSLVTLYTLLLWNLRNRLSPTPSEHSLDNQELCFKTPELDGVKEDGGQEASARKHAHPNNLTAPQTKWTQRKLRDVSTTTIAHQNRQCLKTTCLIVGVFLICMTPCSILWPIHSVCSTCVSEKTVVLANMLGYLHFGMNPLIFLLTNRKLRLTLCKKIT